MLCNIVHVLVVARGVLSHLVERTPMQRSATVSTRSIARAYGRENITAFDVAPGFTRTAMAQDFIDEYGEEYVVDQIALASLTEPDDVATIVTFLASGLADHATGTTIDVNAGSYVH